MGKTAVLEQRPAAMRESRDIEWLVNWALEKQRAHVGGFGGDGSFGPAELRSQLGALGMKVDGGRYKRERRVVHDDAEVIWDQLNAMVFDDRTSLAATLVFNHGRLATQPDWGYEGVGRHVLVRRAGSGKVIKRYDDPEHSRGLLGFEWEFVGHTVEQVEVMMLEYAAWHAALRELREQINSQMRTYVATGPKWHPEPWNDPVYVRSTRGE